MKLDAARLSATKHRVEFDVTVGGAPITIFFESDDTELTDSAEAIFAITELAITAGFCQLVLQWRHQLLTTSTR